MHVSEVLQMSSSKFYVTNKFTDRQKRSELESGPPTKNSTEGHQKTRHMKGTFEGKTCCISSTRDSWNYFCIKTQFYPHFPFKYIYEKRTNLLNGPFSLQNMSWICWSRWFTWPLLTLLGPGGLRSTPQE